MVAFVHQAIITLLVFIIASPLYFHLIRGFFSPRKKKNSVPVLHQSNTEKSAITPSNHGNYSNVASKNQIIAINVVTTAKNAEIHNLTDSSKEITITPEINIKRSEDEIQLQYEALKCVQSSMIEPIVSTESRIIDSASNPDSMSDMSIECVDDSKSQTVSPDLLKSSDEGWVMVKQE